MIGRDASMISVEGPSTQIPSSDQRRPCGVSWSAASYSSAMVVSLFTVALIALSRNGISSSGARRSSPVSGVQKAVTVNEAA